MKRKFSTAQSTQETKLESIQLLRAVAAIMVVMLHTAHLFDAPSISNAVKNFGVGVDLFFVISGFVIVYSARNSFGVPGSWRRFVALRLIRIVPTYWIALTLRLILLAGGAYLGAKSFPSASDVVTSYLFVPYDSQGYGADYPFPILDLGWSLNYEMFFYTVFAVFIMAPMTRAITAMIVFLTLGAVASQFWNLPLPFSFWFQPIVLEFAGGMLVAVAYIHGMTTPRWGAPILCAAAYLLWFHVDMSQFVSYGGPGFYSFPRFAIFGGGALCILIAAVLTRDFRLPQPLIAISRLGESSYALYLFHPFVLLAFKGLLSVWMPSGVALLVMYLIAILTSVVVANAFHIMIEKPIGKILRERFGTQWLAKPAA